MTSDDPALAPGDAPDDALAGALGDAPDERPTAQQMAEALIGVLIELGIRDVVYCPGSRSAPLAYALHRFAHGAGVRTHIRLDERAAAFTAVGLSRAAAAGDVLPTRTIWNVAGRANPSPVAVITTSGGAVAELHAGLAEADYSGLPVIALTADRPFELRDTGASQTMRQAGIFGSTVRGEWDIPVGSDPDVAWQVMRRAVAAAQGTLGGSPGPVHVNVAFRDPLIPLPIDEGDAVVTLGDRLPAPLVCAAQPRPIPWRHAVFPGMPTVIVAGDGADPAAAEWATRGGLPILGEPTCGLTDHPNWIAHHQLLLAGEPGTRIRQVILTGRPTLSRSVQRLLARDGVRLIVVAGDERWPDLTANAALVVPALEPPDEDHHHSGYYEDTGDADDPIGSAAIRAVRLQHWKEESRSLDDFTSGGDGPNILSVARAVWHAPADILLLGASNSVRAVDIAADRGREGLVVANRGLAGIDGTIATAFGLSWGSGKGVRALIGDLAFHHDSSALALTDSNAEPDVQVVVLDDAGGSIFATLEHGRPEYAVAHDEWFRTAQLSDISALARAHGAEVLEPASLPELQDALQQPIRGRSVVRVPISGAASQLRDVIRNAPRSISHS